MNPTSFLNDLPLTLTRYGRPFLLVTSIGQLVEPAVKTERHRCDFPNCTSYETEIYEVEIDFVPKDFYLCTKHAATKNT